MDWTYIGVIALAACLIGLSKGGVGGPGPVSLTAPLLSFIMPVPQAVGLVLPLLIFADIFALRAYWKQWDMRYVQLMLPAGVVGVAIGVLLLSRLDEQTLRYILGVFTLIAVIYKLANDSLKSITYTPQDWHGYLAGAASGFGSAIANVGAPPFTAYMLMQKVTPTVFIGTTTLFFAIINLLKLPGFLSTNVINIEQLLGIAWVLPLIPINVWIGSYIVKRINPLVFEWLIISLLAWAGVTLLIGGTNIILLLLVSVAMGIFYYNMAHQEKKKKTA